MFLRGPEEPHVAREPRRYGVPQKKSAKKRLRQTGKRNERNRSIKSRVATAGRNAKAAPHEDRDAALKRARSAIDRAVKGGAIKKETASRKKSRLVKELGGTA